MAFSCSVRNTAGHLQVITAVRKMGSGWLRSDNKSGAANPGGALIVSLLSALDRRSTWL